MEEQSQVEELQKTVQEQGSQADDVSNKVLVVFVKRTDTRYHRKPNTHHTTTSK